MLYIFDFDGTIVDTKELMRKGIIDFTKFMGLPMPDVDMILNGGYLDDTKYDFGWGLNKVNQTQALDMALMLVSNKMASGDYIPNCFEGAIETIKTLYEKGNTLAILTSREGNGVLKVLEHYNLTKYFTSIKTRDEYTFKGKKKKPDPELIFDILSETKFDKEQSYMLGDAEVDIQAGQNAGIKTVACSFGGFYDRKHLQNFKPDLIVDKFSEILKI